MDIFKAPCPPKGELRGKSSSVAWRYSFVEVEEIKFGVVQTRRSFPYGEGDGEWGLMNKIVVVQGSASGGRDDEMNY